MPDNTWEINGTTAVFHTRFKGDIVIDIETYNGFIPEIKLITTGQQYYHEYNHFFNTEIRVGELPLSTLNAILKAYPTPFTGYFAGPGFVYGGSGPNDAIVNVTVNNLHLLDPGLVERRIIEKDGYYYIETIGIGVGYLGQANTNEAALETAWGFLAGVNFKMEAFEFLIEPRCFPAGTSIAKTLDGQFQQLHADRRTTAVPARVRASGAAGVVFLASHPID